MATGIYYSHPACLEHDPRVLSPEHPDVPERLVTLEAALAAREWLQWERRAAPAAAESQLELVHTSAHVRAIRTMCERGGGAIDPDTFVGEASFRAALHAVGAGCTMVRDLLAGDTATGFCGVRPSGHHAEADRAMGFCLFNNVAITAASAIAELGVRRVFIFDWDVHAGNGTAEIFRYRSDVLFASIHQTGLFPGTGPLADAGSGPGEGYTVNLPVPAGSGEELWLGLIREVVLPAATAFEPELVLASAGFDAHARDPLADCRLQTSSFAAIGVLVRGLAGSLGVPLGVVLEGGYNKEVLAECVCETLPALAGSGPPRQADERPAASIQTEDAIARARAQVGRYWPL